CQRRRSDRYRRHRQQPRAALGDGPVTAPAEAMEGVRIRVRGRVQGVGFRPTVWRYAQESGRDGEVLNDGEGLLSRARGSQEEIDRLMARLRETPPPLADIAAMEVSPDPGPFAAGFSIAGSAPGEARTDIAPDAAICAACAAEVLDPFQRRFRYPF